MKLTYIWHDCFVAEFDTCSIVFDFWKDPTVEGNELPRFISPECEGMSISRNKPLYVLVSHHHKDHFVRDVFGWAALFPRIRYIISKDTMRMCRHIFSDTSVYGGSKVSRDCVTVLKSGEEFEDGNIFVRAFGSTDIGNSYLVETEGKRLFHAGDLNAWIWKDESTEREVEDALAGYRSKLGEIVGWLRDSRGCAALDLCMFPVDSRIGTDYFTGAKMFVDEVDVGRFFPMHFGLGEDDDQKRYQFDAVRFDLYANRSRGEYIALQAPYSAMMDS